ARARDLPLPMLSAVCKHRTYGELFAAAFGSAQITAVRIAMAIATHERTLISNQTPYDLDVAGDAGALSDTQKTGRNIFLGKGLCNKCHQEPNFGNNVQGSADQFVDLGFETDAGVGFDPGRFEVTAEASDVGRFRTPSVRNVGLREPGGLLHDGIGD